MPPAFPRYRSVTVTGDVALTAAVEAVIAQLPGISTAGPDDVVTLTADASILTQGGGTTATLRIRRTGLTGTLVGEGNPHNIGASLSARIPVEFDDEPGEVASLVYVLTAVSAVGNATSTDASLNVVIHSK